MKTRFLPFVLFPLINLQLFSQSWEGHAAGLLPDGYQVQSISVVDENTVWANASVFSVVFGSSPVPANHLIKVLRTSDGGETWHSYDVEESMGRFSFDLVGVDSLTAWLTTQDYNSGLGRALYKTEDGGETWTIKLLHPAAGVFVRVFDSQRLMCQNSRLKSWSDDGGETWQLDTLDEYVQGEFNLVVSGNNMADVVGDTVWVGTTPQGRIVRTINYGQTTEFFETGLTDTYLQCVSFKDHLHGLLFYYNFDGSMGVARSFDGGATWETDMPQPPASLEYNLTYVPGTLGTFVTATDYYGFGSEIFWTTDFGDSWVSGGSIEDAQTNSIDFSSPTSGWVAYGAVVADETSPILYKWSGDAFRPKLFVNDDATGLNNGTTWEDAFNDLQDAIAIAEDGDQIWVAEGTYLPGDNPTSTFFIDKNIHLYGGFAGTEATLAERGDPTEHPTILSGDVNGDDVDDDFENNKEDNVMTVVTVGVNVTDVAVIDGFTFRNGHADGTITNQEQRGGGLYTRASVEVRNCFFTQNFASLSGGGAYLYAGSATDGIIVEVSNCKFEKNRSGGTGGGLTPDAWGQNSNFTVTGCEFSENTSQWTGGGISAWTRENANNNNILVEGCSFTKNSTVEFNGGGIQAVFNGANSSFALKNASFIENKTGNFTTAALWGLGTTASGNVEVANCLFEQNSAAYAAGLDVGNVGITGYFTYTVTDCRFINNQASELGGAMEVYGESPSLISVDNCMFEGNTAATKGGAMMINTNHPDFEAVIRNCIFDNNDSPTGAAVDASNLTENPGMTLDASVTFDNCLMNGNTGQAGTINLSNFGNLKLLNCTIADNPAGGIFQNQNSSLALQNTILANPDGIIEYISGASSTTVVSLGGNLFADSSFIDHALPEDLQGVDPAFAGTGEACEFFQLSLASPAINKGVTLPYPMEFDLCGNERVQQTHIDIGAIESPFMTSSMEAIVGKVELSPNPATDFLYLQLPENNIQPFEVSLFDATGKLVGRQVATTGQAIDLQGLAAGMYWIKAVMGERVFTGKFSKF